MIVHITRFVLVTTGALSGFAVSRLIDWTSRTEFPEYNVIFVFIILGVSIGYLLGGIVGRELTAAYARLEIRLADISQSDLLLATLGLLTGLLVSFLAFQPLRLVKPEWLAVVTSIILTLMAAYTGIRVALVKRHEFAAAFPRLTIQGPSSAKPGLAKYLDTSAVIDGRFAELVNLGVLEGELRVPRFVLGELQTLADSADDMKRARGRRGLDLLSRLRENGSGIDSYEVDYPDIPDVDGKLMRLAMETAGVLITVDYNLSKVAAIREIGYLNLNDLATVLRPAFLPGEGLRLEIVRVGKEPTQGVGYLEDGTMVVVQDGSDHVGSLADAEVTSVLQTSAGRMIFARFVSEVEGGD
ncbi:MAG: hypothetical protein PF636_08480 [Actinomycetota bacterium]|jgi:uncharacterized protein YacL|nr:hypothetical protein [Actinomycetota bacterium]